MPLEHHFEQQMHVPHRLAQYGAGRRLDYAEAADPERLAEVIAAEIGRPRRLPAGRDRRRGPRRRAPRGAALTAMPAALPVLVHLAGPLRVDRGGIELAPAEIGSRKGRTLLRLLCARRGDVLTGPEIAGVLWPDEPPADPDAVVASLVSRLRRVLGADAVLGGREGYRLGAVVTDIDRARRLLDDAERAAPAPAFADAQAAVRLIEAGEGQPDEEWLAPVRAELAGLRRRVQRSPFLAGGLGQLEDHREASDATAVATGLLLSMLDRREDALDRIGGPQVNPVLGREVVEGQELLSIFVETLDRLRILGLIGLDEQIERLVSMRTRVSHPDLMELLFGTGLQALRQLVDHVAALVEPAPLRSGLGKDLGQGLPEAQGAVARGQLRIDREAS